MPGVSCILQLVSLPQGKSQAELMEAMGSWGWKGSHRVHTPTLCIGAADKPL